MIRYLRSVVLALFAVSLLVIPRSLPAVAQDATPTECPTTTPEENAALARMYWQEAVWGKQGKIADIVAPDEVHHWGIGGDTHGFDEFLQRWDLFNKAFPDLEFTVDEIAAQDDLVATLWTATGTQSGEWQGIAPTNRKASWTGINIFRIACGRIVESWGEADHVGLRQQLGASDVPAPMASPTVSASPVAMSAATPCPDDTPEANVAVARRWSEDVFNGRDFGVLDEILDPAVVHHGGSFPDAHGVAAVKRSLAALLDAYPDMQLTVEQTVASDDLVAVRWSGTATHGGDFMGIAPTGKNVTLSGINLYRIECGHIVEGWSRVNVLDELNQIRGG
jgi:predicted ester cyclase